MTKRYRFFNILVCSVCVGAVLFSLAYPSEAAGSVIRALSLCARRVIPGIFLFMAATKMLAKCGAASLFSRITGGVLEKALGVSESGAATVLFGLLSGYPTGAFMVGEFLESGKMSREEAQRLLPYVTAASPAFLIGGVGAMFGNTRFGAILLFGQTASALICLLLSHRNHNGTCACDIVRAEVSPLSSLVSTVKECGAASLNICSFVTFFCIFSEMILHFCPAYVKQSLFGAFLSGVCEISCGFDRASSLPLGAMTYAFCGAMLGFGGISVLMQVADAVGKHGLSIGKYFLGKLIQAAICASICLAVYPVTEKAELVLASFLFDAEQGKITAIWDITAIFIFQCAILALILAIVIKIFMFLQKK